MDKSIDTINNIDTENENYNNESNSRYVGPYRKVDTQKGVICIKAKYAKELLKRGYHIIDIKPDRNYKGRTIYVFANEGNIREDLNNIVELGRQGKIPNYGFTD